MQEQWRAEEGARDHGARAGGARPALRQLADRLGIVPEYVDQTGTERRETSDETRVALLGVMGFDVATEAQAQAVLDGFDAEACARLLDPTAVVPVARLGAHRVDLCIPAAATGTVSWLLVLEAEDGRTVAVDGETEAGTGPVALELPARVGPGYHRLRAHAHWRGGDRTDVQSLIVVPDACWLPAGAGDVQWVGFTANLYTVRSRHDWGIGTISELRALLEWGATTGAAFVGSSPLHALWNRGTEVSPYSPVSRLYRNALYLDVQQVPELAESAEARALLADPGTQAELRRLRAGDRVEYERIAALERPILAALHHAFARRHRGRDTARGREYAAYLEEEGDALLDFATFLALDEHVAAGRGHPVWFREWPEEYRSPDAPGVAAFRERHAEHIDLHCWIQFELDRQLGEAADAARNAGMPIGLYQDLAIGTSGGGSDAWAYQDQLLTGVSIGAPPDLLGPQGQDWGLPPLDPRRLRESGYAYWIQLLRGAFHHAGALRIDHVLGLFRQFWIPWGSPARDGAYVRFPTEDLLGILALESHRHQALVVGEDLGTVPPEVSPTLQRWRVLSSKVMYFEQEHDGAFRRAADYPHDALATANTHDMAPLAGWWEGRELRLRAEAGYTDEHGLREQLAERERTVRRLKERLAAEGLLPGADAPVPEVELRGAVHAFLRRTPAMLVGLSLDDLAGETEPVNMPGLRPEEFPSWTRRMRRTVEELRDDPAVRVALGLDAPVRA